MPREILTHYDRDAFEEGATEFRERCMEILTSPPAEGRFIQAKALALDTDIPAERAIALLAAAPLDRDMNASPGMGLADAHAAAAWAAAAVNIQ